MAYISLLPSSVMIGFIVAIVLIAVITIGYKKAPPDTAYIITGIKKRVLIGKAGIKIPLLERLDTLTLRLININVQTKNAVPTADYININVDATVNVKVSSDPKMLEKAAQNFLSKPTEYIAGVAGEVLEGNLREIIGKMKLTDMVSDRQRFVQEVTESAKPDLNAMGLEIISFNIQNFADDNGVINDLGIDNTEAIKKNAAIARAEAKRDIDIAEASARALANDAQVKSDSEIAERNNMLEMKKAELKAKADEAQARADAVYGIAKAEQDKVLEVKNQEAAIAKQEKEVELRQQMAEAAEKELDATVRRKAEADKYAAEQAADAERYARQKAAEAELIEQQNMAEAEKARAEAARFVAEQNAAAEMERAKGIEAVGRAEAAAVEANGKAEAAAMELKAVAYQKYNNAAMAEMLINVLPDIAGKIAEPMKQIDKITIIGGGSNGAGGVGDVAGQVPVVMSKLFESMKETVGIDLGEVIKANTYDAKVNKNITVSGLPEVNVDINNGAAEAVKEQVTAE